MTFHHVLGFWNESQRTCSLSLVLSLRLCVSVCLFPLVSLSPFSLSSLPSFYSLSSLPSFFSYPSSFFLSLLFSLLSLPTFFFPPSSPLSSLFLLHFPSFFPPFLSSLWTHPSPTSNFPGWFPGQWQPGNGSPSPDLSPSVCQDLTCTHDADLYLSKLCILRMWNKIECK